MLLSLSALLPFCSPYTVNSSSPYHCLRVSECVCVHLYVFVCVCVCLSICLPDSVNVAGLRVQRAKSKSTSGHLMVLVSLRSDQSIRRLKDNGIKTFRRVTHVQFRYSLRKRQNVTQCGKLIDIAPLSHLSLSFSFSLLIFPSLSLAHSVWLTLSLNLSLSLSLSLNPRSFSLPSIFSSETIDLNSS